MAGRQIGKYIPDWVSIARRVPQEARADFLRFRAKNETIKSGLVQCALQTKVHTSLHDCCM